jgi:hypothetical protein
MTPSRANSTTRATISGSVAARASVRFFPFRERTPNEYQFVEPALDSLSVRTGTRMSREMGDLDGLDRQERRMMIQTSRARARKPYQTRYPSDRGPRIKTGGRHVDALTISTMPVT